MRFDDMLATVLARAPDRPSALVAQWRQLLDLLVQRGEMSGDALEATAIARLGSLRDQVPVETRREAVATVAHAPMPAALFAHLIDDVPPVAAALIARASIPESEWLALIPRLGPAGRALLRHRRDLGAQVGVALSAYGAGDLLLTGSTTGDPVEEVPATEAVGAIKESAPAVPESSPEPEWSPRSETWSEPETVFGPETSFETEASTEALGETETISDEVQPIAPDAPVEADGSGTPEATDEPDAIVGDDPRATIDEIVHPDPSVEEQFTAPADDAVEHPLPTEPEDAVFEEWYESATLIAAPIATVADASPDPEAPVELAAPAPEPDRGNEIPAVLPEGRIVSLFGVVQEEEQQELPLSGGEDGAGPFNPDAGRGQIRSIISRIARFRSGEASAVPLGGPLTQFAFETDRTGIIVHVDAAPRGALIGETIAGAAAGPFGVDGQAAGAFRKRAPFRDARLVVAGDGELTGEWRIAGVPAFAPADGRFLGYRGTARRPLGHERAESGAPIDAATPSVTAQRGDTLRQVVHELRTPLNAIGGFAEMIRRQMRGPVAEPYRDRARDIADQAGRLMAAVDDLDIAARLDGERLELQHLPVPLVALLAPVCGEQGEAARGRGLVFETALPLDLPAVLGDAAAIRRMVARLLASAIALAAPDEAVRLEGEQGDDLVLLRVARPRRLAGIAEDDLFDPGWSHVHEAADAPLLGLGFSLHLVRRLALACGGQLRVDDAWFTLRLPVAEPASEIGSAGS